MTPMLTLRQHLSDILFLLPEQSLQSIKPLFNEKLNDSIFSLYSTANIGEMDKDAIAKAGFSLEGLSI
ncbi:MAG: hypothetical protein ACRCTY_06060 [Candidatus Adiutrix sp.]